MAERARDLLACPRLSVISREPDRDLERMAQTIAPCVRVGDLDELAKVLDELERAAQGAAPVTPAAAPAELDEQAAPAAGARGGAACARTLDLFGHSTADGGLLRLGSCVIDAGDPEVIAWFGALGRRGTLSRLDIAAIRLLACGTAVSARGRATICALADHTGIEVVGTRDLLYDAHYDAHGFCDRWRFLLVSASELRRPARAAPPCTGRHRLALAALPTVRLADRLPRAPRRIAPASATDRIVALVRGDAGGELPGPGAPACELALVSARPGAYHVAHVVHDGAFVQFYPTGDAGPAIAYPVADPVALQQILDELATS